MNCCSSFIETTPDYYFYTGDYAGGLEEQETGNKGGTFYTGAFGKKSKMDVLDASYDGGFSKDRTLHTGSEMKNSDPLWQSSGLGEEDRASLVRYFEGPLAGATTTGHSGKHTVTPHDGGEPLHIPYVTESEGDERQEQKSGFSLHFQVENWI